MRKYVAPVLTIFVAFMTATAGQKEEFVVDLSGSGAQAPKLDSASWQCSLMESMICGAECADRAFYEHKTVAYWTCLSMGIGLMRCGCVWEPEGPYNPPSPCYWNCTSGGRNSFPY